MKYKEVDLRDPCVTFDPEQSAPYINLGLVILATKFG